MNPIIIYFKTCTPNVCVYCSAFFKKIITLFYFREQISQADFQKVFNFYPKETKAFRKLLQLLLSLDTYTVGQLVSHRTMSKWFLLCIDNCLAFSRGSSWSLCSLDYLAVWASFPLLRCRRDDYEAKLDIIFINILTQIASHFS